MIEEMVVIVEKMRPEELAKSLASGNEEAAKQFRNIILSDNQLDMGPIFLALRYQPTQSVELGRFALTLLKEESKLSPYITSQLLYLVTVNYPSAVTGAVRAAFGKDDRTTLIVSGVLLCLTTKFAVQTE